MGERGRAEITLLSSKWTTAEMFLSGDDDQPNSLSPSSYFVRQVIPRPRASGRLIGADNRRQAIQVFLDENIRVNLSEKRLKVEIDGTEQSAMIHFIFRDHANPQMSVTCTDWQISINENISSDPSGSDASFVLSTIDRRTSPNKTKKSPLFVIFSWIKTKFHVSKV